MTSLIILLIAAVLVSALITLKHVEISNDEIKLGAKYRSIADARIVKWENRCKEVCTVTHFKYILNKLYNSVAHKFAKITAGIAKKIEWRARKVAHKSAKAGAEAEAVRENGYLAVVQTHKESLDTGKIAEENKL